jgi:hypothetical protein
MTPLTPVPEDDDKTEEMVRELIEANLDEKSQTVALEWLNKRIACYRAMIELGLLD